jgi:ElaB/YqjD/DUF883 family membrane-anchored ribosome-binding protein
VGERRFVIPPCAMRAIWPCNETPRVNSFKEAAMSDSNLDSLNGDEGTATTRDNGSSANGEFSTMRGLRENARIAMDALRDAGRGASAAVSELGDDAWQAGARTGARLSRQVEAQPMTSVIIAASLGLVAGVLLTRR